MEFGFFLFFAVVAVASALVVVIARSPVHSALALMVSLVQVAALFILLGSPFLAVIQIFVY
ncbi:MAG: NADH-quinone oxidoreductase subunit J, partial [Acidithiobacillus sp.]